MGNCITSRRTTCVSATSVVATANTGPATVGRANVDRQLTNTRISSTSMQTYSRPPSQTQTEIEDDGHTMHMSNHYTVHYPNHDKRIDTALYRQSHKFLVDRHNCFICNKANSRNDPLETHHFYCEKAATNAIDWNAFEKFAKGCYNIQTGENIGNNIDWKRVKTNPETFVDSKYNLIVLCKKHHTSGNMGIHHVPFPEWILQKYPKDGFQFLT
jgi:hypothetical protein